ncbi:MAG: bifunctional 4-hydroxy-2-oxoglutarate aldolase/2-dehydro-3-deoxy-phosphogluconate aldolase [Chitinophagaceae bacterium]|jgi:2-dehydro-3-deoxyphosphogluconate aldolase/(4S)-4-hydroxy-2-oxoglutarate aldolase|nr:bifunctional 4-hydroxy-2-oxoglutarate aldolase/2-dehydro-3-deoxy-phosphogluconate aldolase [Chitinophagaceae bacterium]OQY97004.1 MAG: bifunctional 4-hydroxy-2-oxoglutarate aldolase/2-dehydro-3-deoxy-phosphogluconate aldolase [Sphingobacteriales bacterium UTBCD1]
MNIEEIIKKIKESGFLPLFYHHDRKVCIEIVRAMFAAGVRIAEFVNRGPQAAEIFNLLVKTRDVEMKDLILAAGTIKSAADAETFIQAGADLLISPVFDKSVLDVTSKHRVLWIPGCMTPSEIHTAEKSGCTLIKLFPGNILGPSFVEAVKPLFTELDFIVTGGVDSSEKNLVAWYRSGVCSVGMGSKLIGHDVLKNKNYDELKEKIKKLVVLIKRLKSE